MGAVVVTLARTVAQVVLTVAGFVAFTLAAWTVAAGLGLLVAGLGALTLEFLLGHDGPGSTDRGRNRP